MLASFAVRARGDAFIVAATMDFVRRGFTPYPHPNPSPAGRGALESNSPHQPKLSVPFIIAQCPGNEQKKV